MVARLTIGKKKYADVEKDMEKVIKKAASLGADLSKSVEKDAAAFEGVMAAFKLPRSSEKEKKTRAEAIQNALFRLVNGDDEIRNHR